MSAIERLRELEAAATPGPWVTQSAQEPDRERWFIDTHAYAEGPEPVIAETYPLDDHDAALIAATRNALPALLDVAEAAEAALAPEPGHYGGHFASWLGASHMTSERRYTALRDALAKLDEVLP